MVTTKTRSKTVPNTVTTQPGTHNPITVDLEAAANHQEIALNSPETLPPNSVTPEKHLGTPPKSDNSQKATPKPTKYNRSVKPLTPSAFSAHPTSSNMSFSHRLCVYRTKTGEALFQAKLPRLNDKSAYTSPQENFIQADVALMQKYKLTKYCTLRGDHPNMPLSDGRTGVWKVGVYIHENPDNNTDTWVKRWGNNWAKLYHQLTLPDRHLSKYENQYTAIIMQDDNGAAQSVLGDFLVFEDVLGVIADAYTNENLRELMLDDAFVSDYFGASYIVEARVMFNQLYGEQAGNLTVNPNMNNDPTNLIAGFEPV